MLKTVNSQSKMFFVLQRTAGAEIAVFEAFESAAVSWRRENLEIERLLFFKAKYLRTPACVMGLSLIIYDLQQRRI